MISINGLAILNLIICNMSEGILWGPVVLLILMLLMILIISFLSVGLIKNYLDYYFSDWMRNLCQND